MKKHMILAGLVCLGLSSLAAAPSALAQGAPQMVAPIRATVDVGQLSMGWRMSKIRGATVYNDANAKVGTIDDLIVSREDRILYAVVSVGGFLGMGKHLVAVPYTSIRMQNNKMILPGATKDALKAMPEFKYARA
jgi:sporulation protein YlmC with PRC-barrel domain